MVRTRTPENLEETRRALANCADVIFRAHKELLQQETCVLKLAGEECERGGAVEALLRDATHRLPVLAIWRKHYTRRKVHPKNEDRRPLLGFRAAT